MDNLPENIDRENTVISLEDEIDIFNKTFTIQECCNWLNQFIGSGSYISKEQAKMWTEEGVKVKILQPNKKWRSGKIRINFEFIPDVIESPLDDMR